MTDTESPGRGVVTDQKPTREEAGIAYVELRKQNQTRSCGTRSSFKDWATQGNTEVDSSLNRIIFTIITN